jgi:hypothetical protein
MDFEPRGPSRSCRGTTNPAASQPIDRPARIGVIVTTPALKDAFSGAVRDAGYVDGQNAVVVHRPLGDAAIREVLAQRVADRRRTRPLRGIS